MSDERLRLIFDEAVRAIEMQAQAVDEARSRAGAQLTAGAIVASFLGAGMPPISAGDMVAQLDLGGRPRVRFI
jgi:hypothetical protein